MTTYIRSIDPVRLKAIALFAAKQDVRYYLNGVCFEIADPRFTVMVATDGHRLAALPSHEHEEAVTALPADFKPLKVIIDSETIAKVLKVHGRSPLPLTLTVEVTDGETPTRTVTLASVEGARIVGEIDGRYPEYRRVIPEYQGGSASPLNFDGSYLSTFAQAARVLGDRTQAVCIMTKDNNSASRIAFPNVPDFIGVIIGIRGLEEGAALPAWYTEPRTA